MHLDLLIVVLFILTDPAIYVVANRVLTTWFAGKDQKKGIITHSTEKYRTFDREILV